MKAVQSMKVNIGGGNQGSRSVPFDVILNVGNTLNSLAVTFDLSTDADMTIANELSGMTAEQRSVQAMNMLLYNLLLPLKSINQITTTPSKLRMIQETMVISHTLSLLF